MSNAEENISPIGNKPNMRRFSMLEMKKIQGSEEKKEVPLPSTKGPPPFGLGLKMMPSLDLTKVQKGILNELRNEDLNNSDHKMINIPKMNDYVKANK